MEVSSKNPVIPITQFKQLQILYPSIPSYSISDELTKVPAGWLIEQCGFKGKRFGDAGIHQHQALVLVNYGKASGEEIWEVAKKIQKEVAKTFGISIQAEVNVY